MTSEVYKFSTPETETVFPVFKSEFLFSSAQVLFFRNEWCESTNSTDLIGLFNVGQEKMGESLFVLFAAFLWLVAGFACSNFVRICSNSSGLSS